MSRYHVRNPSLTLVLTLALSLASGSTNSSARAAQGGVTIGEVQVAPDSGAGSGSDLELGRTLRAALSEELARVALTPLKRSLIVSATLTRLSSERRDQRTKATALISLALRRADDQVLFAELRGRSSVEESTADTAALRRTALQGAVRGALARLAEVVQRAP